MTGSFPNRKTKNEKNGIIFNIEMNTKRREKEGKEGAPSNALLVCTLGSEPVFGISPSMFRAAMVSIVYAPSGR